MKMGCKKGDCPFCRIFIWNYKLISHLTSIKIKSIQILEHVLENTLEHTKINTHSIKKNALKHRTNQHILIY